MKKQLAILWDVNGVLVDSEPLHVEKLLATTAKYGVTLRAEDFAATHDFKIPDGHGGTKNVSMHLHGAGDKNMYYWALTQKPELVKQLSLRQWLDELLAYYIDHEETIKPRDHMIDLVNRLAKEGAIQGMVTSGIPGQVNANRSVLKDAAHKMAFVLNGDQVKQSKPDPEGYLLGKQKSIFVAADNCIAPNTLVFIAVEDSPSGVKAALAAGLPCIQFLRPGQQPAEVPADCANRFTVVKTGVEVENSIRAWLADASFNSATSPDHPVDTRKQGVSGDRPAVLQPQ